MIGKILDSCEEAVQISFQPQNERMQSKWVKITSNDFTIKGMHTETLAGKFFEKIYKLGQDSIQFLKNNN